MKIALSLLALFLSACTNVYVEDVPLDTLKNVVINEAAGGYTFEMPPGWMEIRSKVVDQSQDPDVIAYTFVGNPEIEDDPIVYMTAVRNVDNAEAAFEKLIKAYDWDYAKVMGSAPVVEKTVNLPASLVSVKVQSDTTLLEFESYVFQIEPTTFVIVRNILDEMIGENVPTQDPDYYKYQMMMQGYDLIISTFKKFT